MLLSDGQTDTINVGTFLRIKSKNRLYKENFPRHLCDEIKLF